MYYKNIIDGHIIGISTGAGQIEITQEEDNAILAVIQSRPTPEIGFDYVLREDLTWEQVEVPEPVVDDEVNAEEALNIILGGEV